MPTARLIVFSGLPGVGKSTIAARLAQRLDAAWLRIDAIEHGLRDSHLCLADDLKDAGYAAARVLAADNLRLGRSVIADAVHGLAIVRDPWLDVARRVGSRPRFVHLVCSDLEEHRRRVEQRTPLDPGARLPRWAEVEAREFAPWPDERKAWTVETARGTAAEIADDLAARITADGAPG